MSGPLQARAVETFGDDFVDHNIEIWSKMLVVLATGEHRPTHIRARKPLEVTRAAWCPDHPPVRWGKGRWGAICRYR